MVWKAYIPHFWNRRPAPPVQGHIGTVVNEFKDRSLAGKKRVKARKANRATARQRLHREHLEGPTH